MKRHISQTCLLRCDTNGWLGFGSTGARGGNNAHQGLRLKGCGKIQRDRPWQSHCRGNAGRHDSSRPGIADRGGSGRGHLMQERLVARGVVPAPASTHGACPWRQNTASRCVRAMVTSGRDVCRGSDKVPPPSSQFASSVRPGSELRPHRKPGIAI